MQPFTFLSFALRFFFALCLVLLSFNPSEYSYFHWVLKHSNDFGPLMVIAGIILTIGWVIYLRATFNSLGALGLVLASVFFGSNVWLLYDLGWISINKVSSFMWAVEIAMAFILAIGMSWSHIRRRLSGQYDTDEIEG